MIINFKDHEMLLEKGTYTEGHRTSLALFDSDTMECFAVVSKNFPDDNLEENEIAYDENKLPEDLIDVFLDNNLLEFAGKYITSGFVNYPVYKVLF